MVVFLGMLNVLPQGQIFISPFAHLSISLTGVAGVMPCIMQSQYEGLQMNWSSESLLLISWYPFSEGITGVEAACKYAAVASKGS